VTEAPATMQRIPFLDLAAAVTEVRRELDEAYARVMDSGWFVGGPEVEDFEAAFARSCGTAHAVGAGNGLDALAMALEASGVGPGDEVVVPAHTFIATWLAVAMVGATPVAAEPERGGFNLSAATVEPVLSARTKAIVPVHLYGEPAPMEAILALAEESGLVVVEDAAQAQGARIGNRSVGGFGRAAAFSFYPGKNLGAFGDAGAITTDDPAIAARLKALRNYGSARRYEHDSAGRNSRLDSLQAAFLQVRLARLEDWNRRRRAIAAIYRDGLLGMGDLVLPEAPAGFEPVWHLYVVRTRDRDALAAHLAAAGIDTLVHYPRPVYRYPPFAAHGPRHQTASDRITAEILSLPMGLHLAQADAHRVVDVIEGFFRGRGAA